MYLQSAQTGNLILGYISARLTSSRVEFRFAQLEFNFLIKGRQTKLEEARQRKEEE